VEEKSGVGIFWEIIINNALFGTPEGKAFLAWLERRCGLCVVDVEWVNEIGVKIQNGTDAIGNG